MSNTTTSFIHLTDNLCNGNDTVSDNCNNENMYNAININDPCDTPSISNELRLKNLNRLVIGESNINSVPSKFEQLKLIIKRFSI